MNVQPTTSAPTLPMPVGGASWPEALQRSQAEEPGGWSEAEWPEALIGSEAECCGGWPEIPVWPEVAAEERRRANHRGRAATSRSRSYGLTNVERPVSMIAPKSWRFISTSSTRWKITAAATSG